MLIDGFTVAAQGVNFLILVWLLKRFLYGPILAAIDAREESIKDRLAQSATQLDAAKSSQEKAAGQSAELEARREDILEKSRREAGVEGGRLLEEARHAADSLSRKRLEALRVEEESLSQSLIGRAHEEAFRVARQVLKDLGGVDLDGRMVEAFLVRLNTLDETDRADLGEALKGSLVVRSTFEMAPAQRQAISEAIASLSDAPAQAPSFQISSDLLAGLELIAGGRRLSWSASNYVSALESTAAKATDQLPAAAPR